MLITHQLLVTSNSVERIAWGTSGHGSISPCGHFPSLTPRYLVRKGMADGENVLRT